MFQGLVIAFALPFFLLGLDAVEILLLPGWVEATLYFVAGSSLLLGAFVFGPSFFQRIFGR